MTAQSSLTNKLTNEYESFENSRLPQAVRSIYRDVDTTRLFLSEILGKYAENGKIPRNKVNPLITELPKVEQALYRSYNQALRREITTTAEQSATTLGQATFAALGPVLTAQLIGLETTNQALNAALAEASFGLLFGLSVVSFGESVLDAVFNRTEDDGKRLIDRLRDFAIYLREGIARIIRDSIRKGEDVPTILRKIDRLYKEEKWKVDRLAESEVLKTYRTAIAKASDNSKFVKGVRIIDFPHGDPVKHRQHNCYILARRDEYGLGQGVYPTNNQKVRNPHPQCRSVLVPIFTDEVNEGGAR